jgi:hypothetical protein
MWRTLFFIPLVLTLAGCASNPTVGMCPLISNLRYSNYEPVQDQFRLLSRHTTPPHRVNRTAAIASLPKEPDAPEPRFTSTEWWQRENARVGKAMVICRGCLPTAILNALPPKPLVSAIQSSAESND